MAIDESDPNFIGPILQDEELEDGPQPFRTSKPKAVGVNGHKIRNEASFQAMLGAAFGTPQAVTAARIGISERTLRRRYAHEIAYGKHHLVQMVGEQMVKQAMKGDFKSMAYLLSRVGKWRDPDREVEQNARVSLGLPAALPDIPQLTGPPMHIVIHHVRAKDARIPPPDDRLFYASDEEWEAAGGKTIDVDPAA